MLPVRIALRFLRSSRTQTILIMVGLGVGVAVQIFVGMLLQNLQDGFVDSVVGSSSHVTVLPGEDEIFISDWEAIVREMEGITDIDVVSVSADSSALLTRGEATRSIFVRGFIFEDAEGIYGIGEVIYEGSLPSSDDEVLLGLDLNDFQEERTPSAST